MDSGMFYGIQKGAVEALQLPGTWFSGVNKIYEEKETKMRELTAR